MASSRATSAEEARARVGRWLLFLAVLGSALGLGAVHTSVLAAVAVVAAIGTALLWYDAEPLEPRPAASMLVLVAVVLIGWTCLQLVPLPRGLLEKIAAENADIWARCLSPLREPGPEQTPISLDPTASRVQILRGVTYLVVFVGALRVARRQEGVVFLERAVVASAVAVAFAAVTHPALGARKVFGLYEPKEWLAYDAHHLGPLLNTNHLAAYLNIGLLLAFGAVVDRRDALPRPLAAAIVLLLAPTVVWTLSRGGTATMVLGTLLAGLLMFGARRTRRSKLAGPAVVLLAAIAGGAMFSLAMFEDTVTKFAHNDLSKLSIAKNALELLESSPVVGVGRGAFESTFPKFWRGTGYWVFTHPENILVQWTTEWGLPIALAGFVAIGWALRPRTALARSRVPAGAWAALVAVATHNLVDFNSEVPAVVIALAVCAAIVTGGTGGGIRGPQRGGAWSRRPRVLTVALAVATVAAVAATLPFTAHELYNEQRAFRDVGLDRSLSRESFHALAREVMRRHPAEPYFPFVGAVRAMVARDESLLPWAGRVLERSPVHGRVHLLLARSMFVRNPSQARLEYRIACEQDTSLCVVQEALPLVGDYYDAMELVPEGPRGVPVLKSLAERLGSRLPSTVVRLDRELSARDPADLDPVRRSATAVMRDIVGGEPWCSGPARQACLEEGLLAARRLRIAAPDKCDGHALVAELRIAAGEPDAGFSELDAALDQVTERSACARRLVTLAEQTGNPVYVDAALGRLLKLGCEAPPECVTNLVFAAEVESRRGSHRRALALMRKAWERAPERDELLGELARRAEAQGLHGEALEAYTKLLERHPDDPRWAEAVAREREAVARGVFQRR
jgi:tetratricopeptide (TPR) repeat protein